MREYYVKGFKQIWSVKKLNILCLFNHCSKKQKPKPLKQMTFAHVCEYPAYIKFST